MVGRGAVAGAADERRRVEAAAARNDEPLTVAERTELARLRKQVAEQEKDIAFLKKSLRVLCRQPTEVDRFELMAAECATTAITRMARLLEVSTSGYYKRANRSGTIELTDREQRKADLTVKIIDHHRDSGGVYGSPLTFALNDAPTNPRTKPVDRPTCGPVLTRRPCQSAHRSQISRFRSLLPVLRAQLRWMEAVLAVWRGDFAESGRHHGIAAHVHQQTELYEAGSGLVAGVSLAEGDG
jgi:hypothetical protein